MNALTSRPNNDRGTEQLVIERLRELDDYQPGGPPPVAEVTARASANTLEERRLRTARPLGMLAAAACVALVAGGIWWQTRSEPSKVTIAPAGDPGGDPAGDPAPRPDGTNEAASTAQQVEARLDAASRRYLIIDGADFEWLVQAAPMPLRPQAEEADGYVWVTAEGSAVPGTVVLSRASSSEDFVSREGVATSELGPWQLSVQSVQSDEGSNGSAANGLISSAQSSWWLKASGLSAAALNEFVERLPVAAADLDTLVVPGYERFRMKGTPTPVDGLAMSWEGEWLVGDQRVGINAYPGDLTSGGRFEDRVGPSPFMDIVSDPALGSVVIVEPGGYTVAILGDGAHTSYEIRIDTTGPAAVEFLRALLPRMRWVDLAALDEAHPGVVVQPEDVAELADGVPLPKGSSLAEFMPVARPQERDRLATSLTYWLACEWRHAVLDGRATPQEATKVLATATGWPVSATNEDTMAAAQDWEANSGQPAELQCE